MYTQSLSQIHIHVHYYTFTPIIHKDFQQYIDYFLFLHSQVGKRLGHDLDMI
jgi:hypothetical protein